MAVTPSDNPISYNVPTDGNPATIDAYGITGDANQPTKQMYTQFWYKKAIIDAQKEQYFGQLASTINMPKHFGKEIVRYQYIPLLDDRNVNDQGIDASGAHIENGNLYGSSKDIGKILSKLPKLGEHGGRVNRVGFSRTTRKGTLDDYGFFFEWTEDSLNFDSDAELYEHMYREAIRGASELTEDMLQADLIQNAGVRQYAGGATNMASMTATGTTPSILTYKDLQRLDQTLTDNRVKYDTKVISGSRMIDTKVVGACRIAFVGSEMAMFLQDMLDNQGKPAFIPVEHYAAGAGHILRGEIGKVGKFRIIQVPEMEFFEGAGAVATNNPGYNATEGSGGKYNVYPFLVVGDDAFNTVGFVTDGAHDKWKIYIKKPGEKVADRQDPYGKTGFCSIQFWYGFLANRPERIAVLFSLCPV